MSPAAGPKKNANVRSALAALERAGSKKVNDGYARYGIVAPRAFGVPMDAIRRLGKSLGRDHALALALWDSGWYEARLLAVFVDDPAAVTPDQMERWARDFDNWAVCDTACFALFDRSPHAWKKVAPWSRRNEEFVRRAAFALLASLALHDKEATDAAFRKTLPLAARAAADERNFVKKGVSWALRAIGARSAPLHAATIALAKRLAAADASAARWIGRDTLRDLERPLVRKRIATRAAKR